MYHTTVALSPGPQPSQLQYPLIPTTLQKHYFQIPTPNSSIILFITMPQQLHYPQNLVLQQQHYPQTLTPQYLTVFSYCIVYQTVTLPQCHHSEITLHTSDILLRQGHIVEVKPQIWGWELEWKVLVTVRHNKPFLDLFTHWLFLCHPCCLQ